MSEDREKATATLIAGLDRIVELEIGMTIAVYWPIRGEPDIRLWMRSAHAAGARLQLPVVIEEKAPLEFHRWTPKSRMTRGVWNILVPADCEAHVPDIVMEPLVGVDEQLYRLGNGRGFYDRTLVRIEPLPRIIGVGFHKCLLPTIYRMPRDVPMREVQLLDGTYFKR